MQIYRGNALVGSADFIRTDCEFNLDDGICQVKLTTKDIYEKFLKKLFEKQLMEDLKIKLKEKNYEEAFRIAHDLKGTSGNLSVTLFYKKICEIVENLREERNEESLLNLYNQAEMLYLNAKKAVGDE